MCSDQLGIVSGSCPYQKVLWFGYFPCILAMTLLFLLVWYFHGLLSTDVTVNIIMVSYHPLWVDNSKLIKTKCPVKPDPGSGYSWTHYLYVGLWPRITIDLFSILQLKDLLYLKLENVEGECVGSSPTYMQCLHEWIHLPALNVSSYVYCCKILMRCQQGTVLTRTSMTSTRSNGSCVRQVRSRSHLSRQFFFLGVNFLA